MRPFTFLCGVLTATAVNAIPAPASEPLTRRDIPLLRLYDIKDVTWPGGSSYFTGRGNPGECYNLPENVSMFGRADAAVGYRCDIFTQSNCQGSSLTVETGYIWLGIKGDLPPVYMSWMCEPISDDPFPPYKLE